MNSLIELKNKDYIVSGGWDKKIIFWENSTYDFVEEINDVYCCYSNSLLEVKDNRIIVGGENEVILINGKEMKIEKVVELQSSGYIRCIIEMNDGTVLCGCENELVHLSNDEYDVIYIKEEPHDDETSGMLMLKDDRLITCSWDNSIKVWK